MKLLLSSLFALGIVIQISAQQDTGTWAPTDIIGTEFMQSVVIAPDGMKVAWTKRKADKEKDKFISDIYLSRLDALKDNEPRIVQMTDSDENDSTPLFSRDGEDLYFLSGRDKGKKLWRMSLYGGEPQEVHEFKQGISNMQWVSDSTFAYLSNDGKTLYDQEKEEAKDDVVVVEDSVHWTKDRIYLFNLKNKNSTRLTTNNYPVSSYQVSKDGRWMVYRLTRSRHYATDAHPKPAYYLHSLADGTTRQILQDYQTPGNWQFIASGNGFYFGAVSSSDPEWNGAGVTKIYYYDLNTHEVTQVPLDWAWESEGDFSAIGDDLLVALPNGPTNRLAFYRKNGLRWTKSLVDMGPIEAHVWIQAVSDDGSKVVYEHSTASQLPRYYLAEVNLSGNELQLTNPVEICKLNQKLKDKHIVSSEIYRWRGYQDDEVNGMLYYPADYEPGKRYPLVLSIHGGPTGVDTDRWRERWSTYPQIIAQRGAFVLKPNYHGSSHHGQSFMESIKGNYYEPELEDIIKGINALVADGKVDRMQLGVMGWSNGAILATMLTVRYPDMFKVACPGAGDVNWTSDFGTCRFGVSFDQSYFGGAPWDDVDGKFYNETYIIKSPLFELEKVRTPTIIFHGSEDRAVPRDQGWEYYRALQQAGKTPVRFLWFPGQPHGLGKITHQLRKMEEELTWIDRYLFGKEAKKNEAIKEKSLLATALKQQELKHNNGIYGTLINGVILPEMQAIKTDSLSISIFEVTNAQFAAYDPDHNYAPVHANHPAVVALAEAQSYVIWITERTGETYRLPNAQEAEHWHKLARKVAAKENTLNHWAGYDLTWEEVDMLADELDQLGADMIRSVGSYSPTTVGKAHVYDLGGNVAELTESGTTYGYSAADYVDPTSTENRSPKFTGFRLVREE